MPPEKAICTKVGVGAYAHGTYGRQSDLREERCWNDDVNARQRWGPVSTEPEREFIFPTGRVWAEELGYAPELANVPEETARSFAG